MEAKTTGNFTSYVDLDLMMSQKFWGEEHENEAIYSVYLRKVRYNCAIPSTSSYFFAEDPIAHLQWETVKERQIKAGSVRKLVDALISCDGEIDGKHFNAFFHTYRAFAKPKEILNLLLIKYERSKELPSAHLSALRSILQSWIDKFPDDFRNDPDLMCLTVLIEFARSNLPHLSELLLKGERLRAICNTSQLQCNVGSHKPSHRESVQSACLFAASAARNEFDTLLGSYGLRERISGMHELLNVEPFHIAEQMTYWDAELFKRLIPSQCLSCVWNRRHKDGDAVYSVRATIDQFNGIIERVISSIVRPGNTRRQTRAHLIAKWIEVAKELRFLKNYSSLKAVLSGLSSEPIHRLKSLWTLVPRNLQSDFNELSRVFNSNENEVGISRVQLGEFPLKFIEDDDLSSNSRAARKRYNTKLYNQRRAKSDMEEMQGAVPYLGSILTELTHIDTLYSDTIGDLVNFEKRRKEFEKLVEVILFQAAARNYHIKYDPKFRAWFTRLPHWSEQECYSLSLKIESPSATTPDVMRQRRRRSTWFGSVGSLTKIAESDAGASPLDERRPSTPGLGLKAFTTPPLAAAMKGQYAWMHYWQAMPIMQQRSESEFDARIFSPSTPSTPGSNSLSDSGYVGSKETVHLDTPIMKLRSSDSKSSLLSSPNRSILTKEDISIVRVCVDANLQTQDITQNVLYKCIRLENSDKTIAVIRKALEKHQLDGEPHHYCLVQLLPDGSELAVLDNCNVFYALSPVQHELPLIELRKRSVGTLSDHQSFTMRQLKNKQRRNRNNLLRWSSGFL